MASAPHRQPLHGLTFLNTRDARGASELTRRLTALGAAVLECHTLEFRPPESWAPFDARLDALDARDWIAFTSANAVRATGERLRALGRPASVLAPARLAAIGRGTARTLEDEGLTVALQPALAQQEALRDALLAVLHAGERVWIPRAEQARQVLEQGLRAAGYAVEATPVYRTAPAADGLGPVRAPLLGGTVDWLLFTSSSTVTHFLALLDDAVRAALTRTPPRIACIGAVTAATAREGGLAVTVVPAQQDLDGLVRAVLDYVQAGGAHSPA